MKCPIRHLLLLAVLSFLSTPALASTLYVSPSGDDDNPGTEDRPIATLERARDQVRRIQATGGLPDGGIIVVLRGGTYELSQPLEFTKQDSGTENAPIVYRAYDGESVKIGGGHEVTGWKQVTDPAVLDRLHPSARDQVWLADLKDVGITDFQGINSAHTYLHNIHGFQNKGCIGVYLDDCFSSADISGNIFYDVATAILIGGGRDNIMKNNLFLNCGRAFSIDARGLGWAKGVGDFATKELIELNYKQPPWSTKYPELLDILEDDPLAPKGNVMARNICWGGSWGRTQREAEPLVKFEDNLIDVDPRFAGSPPADFQLADDSPAHNIRFQPIPFDKIGVYVSDDRASWPVEHTLRGDPSALPESEPHE